jgi:hypothetical protein
MHTLFGYTQLEDPTLAPDMIFRHGLQETERLAANVVGTFTSLVARRIRMVAQQSRQIVWGLEKSSRRQCRLDEGFLSNDTGCMRGGMPRSRQGLFSILSGIFHPQNMRVLSNIDPDQRGKRHPVLRFIHIDLLKTQKGLKVPPAMDLPTSNNYWRGESPRFLPSSQTGQETG